MLSLSTFNFQFHPVLKQGRPATSAALRPYSFCLRSLLGLHPVVERHLAASNLGPGEWIKLVYRENLQLKHSTKKRLEEELRNKEPPASKRVRKSILNHTKTEMETNDTTSSSMTALLVKYLLQVLCLVFSSVTLSNFFWMLVLV